MSQHANNNSHDRADQMKRPLRVGLRIDRPAALGWHMRLLEQLRAHVELVSPVFLLASEEAGTTTRPAPTLPDRIDAALAHWRYRDHWQGWRIDPEATVGLDTRGLPEMLVETPATLDRLGERIDVLVDLAGVALPVWWHEVAEIATLSLVDGTGARAGSPAFGRDSVLADAPWTNLRVMLEQPGEAAREVASMVIATFRYSWTEQRRRSLAKGIPLLADAVIAQGGLGPRRGAEASSAESAASPSPRPLASVPSHSHPVQPGLGHNGALLLRGLARMARHRFVDDRWELVVGTPPDGATATIAPDAMQRLAPTPGVFWADPFLIEREGETRVFFEVFDYRSRQAHIASGRLAEGGLEDVRQAIAPDYHVSFPFLFDYEGTLYMLPEAHQSGRVSLWRCERFPDRWVPHAVLLEGVSAADAAIVRRGERWWMLVNVDRSGLGEHGEELHIYHAEDPIRGPRLPHPANPVVTDARTARMGGAVFAGRSGALFRPAQKGGDVYGTGLQIMEIVQLDLDGYRERPAGPPYDRFADLADVHHCHVHGGRMIIDHCRRRVRGFGRFTTPPRTSRPREAPSPEPNYQRSAGNEALAAHQSQATWPSNASARTLP
jgi:hypothetical protein